MRSASFILFAAALAAGVLGQSSTQISIFAAGPTQLPLDGVEASVVDANAVATTLAVRCVDTVDQQCVLHSPVTITEGPSTFTMSAVFSTETLGVGAKITLMQDCDITSRTQGASCSLSVGVEVSTDGISTSTSSATHTSYASDEIFYQTLTVTGGIDQLNQPEATQTPDVAAGRIGMGGAAAAVAAAAIGFF